MAISIDTQPNGVQAVYQPIYFQVQSSNYTQPQFRFIFDVYRNGSLIDRVKMLPRPGVNTQIFSPAAILESYLSYDISNFSNDCSQDNCIAQYQVRFGEEYGAVSAPPIIYTNLASSSGYTFNGNIQYEDYYSALGGAYFNEFYLKQHSSFPSNGRFLTDSPTAQTISTTDYACLSCFNFDIIDNGVDYDIKKATAVRYTSYQTSGGSIDTIMYYSANAGTTIDYKLLHFPAGPYNINTIPFGNLLVGKYPPVNTETDYAYDVTLFSTTAGPVIDVAISETRYFEFEDCSKYENVRLKFLNRLGAWDYFNFRLVSRDFISSEKQTFKKNIPIGYYYGYTFGSREKTVFNSINKATRKVTSDFINDETATWLAELCTSPEVYELANDEVGNKVLLPVIITTYPTEIKKRINDKIFNVEFEYEYASDINVQRG